MKKLIIGLILSFSFLFSNSEDFVNKRENSYQYKGRAVQTHPTDSIAVSMATWGVGLVIGIGLLFIFLKPSES